MADFVYIRLHGDKALYASGYGNAALDRWATRINARRQGRQVDDAKLASPTAARRGKRDVFCYFDNDVKVHAPYDATHLATRLGLATGLGMDEELAQVLGAGGTERASPSRHRA